MNGGIFVNTPKIYHTFKVNYFQLLNNQDKQT